MRGQVGYWAHNGIAVGFDHRMIEWAERRKAGRFEVSVDRERRVTCRPCTEGGFALTRRRNMALDYFVVPSDEHPVRCDLPRFGLTFVDFKEVDGCLVAQLPADHELEWPRLEDCEAYKAAELVEDILLSRLLSLLSTGKTSFSGNQRMPDRLRKHLVPGAWARAVETAKTLACVS